MSLPLDRTFKLRPLLTVKPLKTSPEPSARFAPADSLTLGGSVAPPTTSTVPPLETVAPLTMAPNSMISVPPGLTKLPLAVPPNSTTSVPPLINVVVPLSTPPDSRTARPPALTVAPDSMPRNG